MKEQKKGRSIPLAERWARETIVVERSPEMQKVIDKLNKKEKAAKKK